MTDAFLYCCLATTERFKAMRIFPSIKGLDGPMPTAPAFSAGGQPHVGHSSAADSALTHASCHRLQTVAKQQQTQKEQVETAQTLYFGKRKETRE